MWLKLLKGTLSGDKFWPIEKKVKILCLFMQNEPVIRVKQMSHLRPTLREI